MSKECRWVWEKRERGFWARLLFWRETKADVGAWRCRGIAGLTARVDEHEQLLAADERERGW